MSRVWDETRFKGTELLVLLCLADHANDDGQCWPSYARLAKRARCSRRQAMRCVDRLLKEGWITRLKRPIGFERHDTNVFTLHLPPPSDTTSPPPQKQSASVTGVTPLVTSTSPHSVTHVTGVVSPMSPESSGNHHRIINEPLPASRASKSSLCCPSEDDAFEAIINSTTLDDIHASQCSFQWYKKFELEPFDNWRAHVEAFARKYENDKNRTI